MIQFVFGSSWLQLQATNVGYIASVDSFLASTQSRVGISLIFIDIYSVQILIKHSWAQTGPLNLPQAPNSNTSSYMHIYSYTIFEVRYLSVGER